MRKQIENITMTMFMVIVAITILYVAARQTQTIKREKDGHQYLFVKNGVYSTYVIHLEGCDHPKCAGD